SSSTMGDSIASKVSCQSSTARRNSASSSRAGSRGGSRRLLRGASARAALLRLRLGLCISALQAECLQTLTRLADQDSGLFEGGMRGLPFEVDLHVLDGGHEAGPRQCTRGTGV